MLLSLAVTDIIALLVIGLSLGASNFAASVGIGLSDASKVNRWRLGVVFGLFETIMPIIGIVIGDQLAGKLGDKANVIGGGLLIIMGLYGLLRVVFDKGQNEPANPEGYRGLLLAGFALSIDNLVVGFSLGATTVPLLAAVLCIGAISVTMSLIGLEIGKYLQSRVQSYSELLGSAALILVGLAISTGIL